MIFIYYFVSNLNFQEQERCTGVWALERYKTDVSYHEYFGERSGEKVEGRIRSVGKSFWIYARKINNVTDILC